MTDRMHLLRPLLLTALLLAAGCSSAPAQEPTPSQLRLAAYERLGLESIAADRWDRAFEYFTLALQWARSLDQRATEGRAQLNLAWLEERSGRTAEAGGRLQTVLDGPYAAELRAEAGLRLARLAADRGDLAEARRLMAVARPLRALPGFEVLDARLLLLAGQLDPAATAATRLARSLDNEQDKAGAWRLLAEVELARRQPAAALTALDAAYALDQAAGRSSRLAQLLALRARALQQQGQAVQAAASLQRAGEVCTAWRSRFPDDSVYHPAGCGDLAALSAP